MDNSTIPNLPSPAVLLREALVFYRRQFRNIFYLALLPLALGLAWRFLLWFGWSVPLGLELVVWILLNSLTQLIFIDLVAEGETSNPLVSLRRSLHLLGPFLVVTVLTGLAFLGGFVIFFVPGVVVAVWLIFSSFVVVAEQKRSWEALVTSWHYVENYWWDVLAYILIWLAAVIIVPLLLYLAIFTWLNVASWWWNILSFVVSSLLLSPLGMVYMFRLYEEIKKRQLITRPNPGAEEKSTKERWLFILVALGVGTLAGLIFWLA